MCLNVELVISLLGYFGAVDRAAQVEARLSEVLDAWGLDAGRINLLLLDLQKQGVLRADCDTQDLADLATRLLRLEHERTGGPIERPVIAAVTRLLFGGLLR